MCLEQDSFLLTQGARETFLAHISSLKQQVGGIKLIDVFLARSNR